MFSYRGADGPKSNTTSYCADACQVAVIVERHATTSVLVFGRVLRMRDWGRSLLSAIASYEYLSCDLFDEYRLRRAILILKVTQLHW